jgi:hypothetical protein
MNYTMSRIRRLVCLLTGALAVEVAEKAVEATHGPVSLSNQIRSLVWGGRLHAAVLPESYHVPGDGDCNRYGPVQRFEDTSSSLSGVTITTSAPKVTATADGGLRFETSDGTVVVYYTT